MGEKMEKENINTLNEINKGACMGVDAINEIIDKIKDKSMRKSVETLLDDYHDFIERIDKIYSNYDDGSPRETNMMNKAMTKYGIDMKTLMDSSTSKIAELLINGINMGIIEGRKLLNNKNMDTTVHKLVMEYVAIQERALDDLKNYL